MDKPEHKTAAQRRLPVEVDQGRDTPEVDTGRPVRPNFRLSGNVSASGHRRSHILSYIRINIENCAFL
jgi:hypothetical protein